MKLNYLLLDPNDVARLQVRQRLKEIPELSLLNEFSNFNDLKRFLQHESTDLILMDPSENEDKIFNFIEQNGIQDKVIFTSKKSKHARANTNKCLSRIKIEQALSFYSLCIKVRVSFTLFVSSA